ncbi:hypothetical protein Vretimale_10312 [Volvox reticuliferus]|uniref:N-acetyltransferase domain-containing protein n=1 Tax=Volvox reticuliferus TaxID=1737510 RepID=A0A8J4FPF8_9CHLO|nr:hypothetical protein Vretifemale_12327 [Volvox reticuliferus]GIM05939.1 hypothetical protein Vretimale_10312 [Volvox reticuliferus]
MGPSRGWSIKWRGGSWRLSGRTYKWCRILEKQNSWFRSPAFTAGVWFWRVELGFGTEARFLCCRDLRRTRRRRLWACLVAWEDPVPAGGSPHVSAPRFGSDAELMAQRRTDMTQQQLQERVQHEEDVEGGKEEEYSTHGLEPAPSPQWPHVRVCQGQQAAPQRGGGGRQDVCRGGGDSGRSRGGSGADRCSGGESGTASGHGSGDKSGTASGHGSGGESGGRLNQDSRLDRGGVDDEPKAVGYVLVSVSQPLAMLPPPLPSTSPQQFHVDALAVGARFRRQGVGSRLLAAVEQLVMRWGGKSLWLHVDACNDAAVQMYSDRDYGIVRIQRPRLVVPSSLLGRPTIGCRPPFPPFLPHSCLGRLMGASIVSVLQPQSQGHQGGGQGPQLEKQQGQRTHQESPPNSVLFLEQQQLRNPPYSLRNQEQLQQLQVSLAQWRQRQRSRKFVMQKRLQQ